jgi:hypothetical protein
MTKFYALQPLLVKERIAITTANVYHAVRSAPLISLPSITSAPVPVLVSTWPPPHLHLINIEAVAIYRCLTYFPDYKNEPVFGLFLCGRRLPCYLAFNHLLDSRIFLIRSKALGIYSPRNAFWLRNAEPLLQATTLGNLH